MRNLFIIGNGFDLSHKLETSYEDFRIYLGERYPGSSEDKFIMPQIYIMANGQEKFKDVEAVSFLMRIISNAEGKEWNDIERVLGFLDFSECFDWVDYPLDEDGKIDFWKQAYINEDIASNLLSPTIEVSKYFSDWVNTIIINQKIPIKKDFEKIINPNTDLFLTFNYTETLEILYGVKNVCHIHGKQGGELLFGHGNHGPYNYYTNNFIGSEDVIQQIYEKLRKDTATAIKKNKHFFANIDSTISKVYSYGFSFSEIDNLYIEHISKKLTNPNVVWYLNTHNNYKQRQNYKNIIRKSGYKGRFDTYSIRA